MHQSHTASSRYLTKAVIIFAAATLLLTAAPVVANTIYANGFETDTTDWSSDVTRVSSGTGGIASKSGSFHATTINGSFSRWGGYNYGAGNNIATAFQEYTTSLDIYLDVNTAAANDTRFDFDSAVSNSAGGFGRDFIFNGGFYKNTDLTGPGAGTNRFVISASNNTQPGSAFAKNPGRDPIAIDTTGWYTFQHHFYDNGGVLAVDLSIYNSASALVNTWTLSDTTDLISTIGGNRYGWFDYSAFPTLAIDNASLTTAGASAAPVPLPMAAWMGISLVGGLGGFRGIKRLRAR